ncbi:MAG: type III-B CRISPR-associated protein Cas10/Cmr2 [Gammaproteobacteria bacterium]
MRDNKKTLHFNFTPVQSFVAQARRTRDLWAGSYLLAWLSGQAMNAIINDGGDIEMPYIKDDLLMAAIQDRDHASDLAKSLGTLPNRFTAQIPENKDPKEYAQVIQDHWIKVADAVRDRIDPGKSLIDDEFWNRQITNHWEFAWVTGEKSSLDSRKNMRLPTPTEESGEKCTVCGERQELSESKKAVFIPNRPVSKKWWADLRESNLNLRKNERLCAVCLTKRLFPLVAEQAIGWEVEQNYPSTAYLSAIDWLETVLIKAKDSKDIQDAANELSETVKNLRIPYSEYNTHIKGLSDHLKDSGINKRFIDLDGDVFYLSAIEADQLQKRDSNETLSTGEKIKLSAALIELQKAAGSKATPFYALLLMDGDGMGKLIGSCVQQERGEISKALAAFTKRVPVIVSKYNGKLIYAGGDDVFALLPVSKAIACAAQCRMAYQNAFKSFKEKTKAAATISAAVQFAHQNIPLSVVVKDAHRLLDDIAKERTGRDALACRVWKPGGIVLTWAQPWTDEQQTDFAKLIDEVINDFHPDQSSDRFSSKLFYKLRDLFEQIESDSTITNEAIQDLLVAEYLANRELKEKDKEKQRKEAQARIERLLRLCRQQTRHSEEDKPTYTKGKYNADAALLVRFLVQKEV